MARISNTHSGSHYLNTELSQNSSLQLQFTFMPSNTGYLKFQKIPNKHIIILIWTLPNYFSPNNLAAMSCHGPTCGRELTSRGAGDAKEGSFGVGSPAVTNSRVADEVRDMLGVPPATAALLACTNNAGYFTVGVNK